MTEQRLKQLYQLWINDQLTAPEEMELMTFLSGTDANAYRRWFVDQTYTQTTGDMPYTPAETENIVTSITGLPSVRDSSSTVPRVHFLRTAWFRVAVAVILCFGIVGYFLNYNTRDDQGVLTKVTPASDNQNIAPGYSKATLTLSDGKTIELNQNVKEKINDGELLISNTNGELIYQNSSISAINMMRTPTGGQYQLMLADGSRVWLNAVSSITYPTAFSGKTREVTITGEAYFEVARNKTKPFIVHTAKENIMVLGTSFNVNRYSDEATGKISLIEGSVKVGEVLLKPGQAYINGAIKSTNLQQDIAWKNGAFNFEDMDIPTAMRQISRWYAVNVVYQGKIPSVITGGELGRDLNLSELLASLSRIGVETRLNGNTITVLSGQ